MAELAEALSERLGARVTNLRRLPGGSSRETWAFEAEPPSAPARTLVLRREPAGASRGTMRREAALLRAAAGAGVPVPDVLDADDTSLVVGFVDGEAIPRRILRDERYRVARERLVEQAAGALAAVHRIPVDSVEGLEAGDQLEQFRALLASLHEPHPVFELAFRMLAATRPPANREAVVHGDFRLGNLLVDDGGLRAVLDWELAHVGDPLEDLGWFCVKSWRFGSPLPAGGLATREELVDAYEAAGGVKVDPEALRWWEALGTLKWGVMCALQASFHLTGAVRSVELATIGRRICEVEWDLLPFLPGFASAPGGGAAPAPVRLEEEVASDSPRSVPPHDRPTALELLDAVREFLESDVVGATQGRTRFHARVAANAIAIAGRELTLGPALEAAHRRRLDSLGVRSDEELAGRIRAGAYDDDPAALVAVLVEAVRDKLAVANPRYVDGAGEEASRG